MDYCKTTKDRCTQCKQGECEQKYDRITPTEKITLCITAIERFGTRHQIDKSIEEMAELTKALLKWRDSDGSADDVVEEIVDVDIMLMQLKFMYEYDDETEQRKLLRLKEVVENG